MTTVPTHLSEDELSALNDEQRIFEATTTALIAQAKEQRGRATREEERSRELTAEYIATRRVEDKAQLASDEAVSHTIKDTLRNELRNIESLIPNPYFARLVVQEGSQRIEYKLGYQANSGARIIDWRFAPMARLYYEYKEGDSYSEEIQGRDREGTILARSVIEIKKGELRKVTNTFGTFERTADGWKRGEDFRGAAGELQQAVTLLTAEQYQLVSNDHERALIVQGVAGSGKTTVALLRLSSFLLNHEGAEQPQCVVVVRSMALQRFIKEGLLALSMENVLIKTYKEFIVDQFKYLTKRGTQLPELVDHYLDHHGAAARAEVIDLQDATKLLIKKQGQDERLRYMHLTVDEAQDFSAAELELLCLSAEKPHRVTLVGDPYQRLREEESGFILAALKVRFADEAQYIQLRDSFRSTVPIMRLAAYIMQLKDNSLGGREGRVPLWFKAKGERAGFEASAHWLRESVKRYPQAHTAVICRDRDEARHVHSMLAPAFGEALRYGDEHSLQFSAGISVTSVAECKGLEFSNVLVWNPSERQYGEGQGDARQKGGLGRRALYTACTRAVDNLCIVTWQKAALALRLKSLSIQGLLRFNRVLGENELILRCEDKCPPATY